jgi:lipopolysaccharide/colanic/teichoic acid biosynthesis glycosyltransferase
MSNSAFRGASGLFSDPILPLEQPRHVAEAIYLARAALVIVIVLAAVILTTIVLIVWNSWFYITGICLVSLAILIATNLTTIHKYSRVHTNVSYLIIKRVVDLVVAGTMLLLLAPLLVLIALCIVIDSPGPALFRQERVGEFGSRFQMLKFRTMIQERRHNGAPPPGIRERRRVRASLDDPRVTRVGRILRRTCMDELPQLWNVVRGEMSLVGPRPELPPIVEKYEPWQDARHLVTPGITGWWQVNRDQHLMHHATELDVYYVQHQSFWLDVVILARTVVIVLRGIGAF